MAYSTPLFAHTGKSNGTSDPLWHHWHRHDGGCPSSHVFRGGGVGAMGGPVAIVGGGFSGTLMAINLLRYGASVALIERDGGRLARGMAYGTRNPAHLLNVRASNMSAFPDDAGHFLRWLGHGEGEVDQANRFVPRLTYGAYLRDLLDAAQRDAPDRLRIVAHEVLAIERRGGEVALRLDDGAMVEARAAVLALGHAAPGNMPLFEGLSSQVLIRNPWTADRREGMAGASDVLLVGTGLTAVDMALSLDRAGFTGRITAMSRRGLAPRAHAVSGPVVHPVAQPELRGSHLLRHVRMRAETVGWRHAIDELRPHTQRLWRHHDAAAQARFLRHLRPWWDVHRHRLAPEIAQRIAELCAEGRLEFMAGNLIAARPDGDAASVTWRRRFARAPETRRFERIILCTGPQADITRNPQDLLGQLLKDGLARPDVHRLGLDVDHLCHLRNAHGQAQPGLFAIGPMTKGEAWEIVAVPDIRRQVWDLARFLTHSHWVGGEGL